MRFATTLAVALVLTSLGMAPATADTMSLEASADAWGMGGYYSDVWNADMNYGTQTDPYGTVMQCRWTGTAPSSSNDKFWVKFDLSSVTKPVSSATLLMTRKGGATDGYDAVLVGALKDGDPGENWGEYTITYNNAPGNVLNDYTFNSSNMPYVGVLDYPASGAAGDVISLTGAALQQAINDDTNGVLTLGFTKRGYDPNNGAIFASREDSFYAGATLVITTGAATPEPSTLSLLCAGLASLLAYAWRKRK
jgi:hypothetical protein